MISLWRRLIWWRAGPLYLCNVFVRTITNAVGLHSFVVYYIYKCRCGVVWRPSPYVDCPFDEHWTLNMSMNINFIKRLKQPITIIEQREPTHRRSDSLFNIENTISGPHKSMCAVPGSVCVCAVRCASLAAYHVTNEKRNKCPPAYTAWAHVQNQVKRLLITSCFVVSGAAHIHAHSSPHLPPLPSRV